VSLRLILTFLFFFTVIPGFAAAPKLVVLIVGDQVRADYVERYRQYLSTGGLGHFLQEGQDYSNAAYDYGATKTSPGHTLLGSGLYPSESGIIGNEWWDRDQKKVVSAAEIIPGGKRVQLKWFRGTSLAQNVHARFPLARVIGISFKDRAALLTPGSDADEAYWYDLKEKRFVSYGPSVPWLDEWNRSLTHLLQHFPGWDPLVPLDAALTAHFVSASNAYEKNLRPPPGLGLHFPHPILSESAFADTPFTDTVLTDLAIHVIDQWHLGQNSSGIPDVLTISYSGVDLVGHTFGPDSPETVDAFLRLDREIARLREHLTLVCGSDCLWIFSADHGVTPFPEYSRSQGLSAGRVALSSATLSKAPWIANISVPWIYVDDDQIKANHLSKQKAIDTLKTNILALDGVDAVYDLRDCKKGHLPMTIAHSFDTPCEGKTSRNGDLYVVLKRYFIFSQVPYGTTHGQPTLEDQRVPILLEGHGVPHETNTIPVSPKLVSQRILEALQ